jgi:NAD(P)H-hydrate repair Nnr-like enzyme with NAD(P)H-hydrate dehydratase domain
LKLRDINVVKVMVTPWYDEDDIENLSTAIFAEQLSRTLQPFFTRLHAVVIGPGLGRNPKLMSALPHVISKLIASDIP